MCHSPPSCGGDTPPRSAPVPVLSLIWSPLLAVVPEQRRSSRRTAGSRRVDSTLTLGRPLRRGLLGEPVPEADQGPLHREPGVQGEHATGVLGPVAEAPREPLVAGEGRAMR